MKYITMKISIIVTLLCFGTAQAGFLNIPGELYLNIFAIVEFSVRILEESGIIHLLPVNEFSREFGKISSLTIPRDQRSDVFKHYAKLYGANLTEVEKPLEEYASVSEFFSRGIKPEFRPIAEDAKLVIPADGHVTQFGPKKICKVEKIKGITYDLRYFLEGKKFKDLNKTCEDYIRQDILKNPENELYEVVVFLYLADYHRYHSPADWQVLKRRYFRGTLYYAIPDVVESDENVFAVSERVVYTGRWENGFLAYIPIGATTVDSMRSVKDETLRTNTGERWPKGQISKDKDFDNFFEKKGELFGEFRIGSTVAVLFEAPKDLKFRLKKGQKVQYGQPIA